jgi:hypothetical protein
MNTKSLFFIPDISGFTSFVQDMDLNHSQHIISELLELIIDEDELGLSLAEIEGDAVFFYKNGEIPSFDAILKQVHKTYTRFHEHLKLYDTQRVCNCGACSSASGLTLKFIIHVGESSLINVKGHSKPYGPEVIKVHRLMKNSIDSDDYALFSQDLMNELKSKKTLLIGKDEYGDLGEVYYQSTDLSHLKLNLPEPKIKHAGIKTQQPIETSISIASPKKRIFKFITDFSLRKKWDQTPSKFKFNPKDLNRIGSKHICIIDNTNYELETVTQDFGKDKLVYGETTADIFLFREATSYFILEGDDKSTKLKVEFHFKLIPIIGWLLKPVFIKKYLKSIHKKMKLLKQVAEAA